MSADDEETTFDLCIVGAGMFGSAAARHASADPCLRVCLVGPGEPASAAEWGVREVHSAHYDEGRIVVSVEESAALQQLARASVARFGEVERMAGIAFYQPAGALLVAERKSARLLRWMEAGAPLVDLSSKDAFSKRFPFLRLDAELHPFLDDCGAGYVSARRMVEAEQKIAVAQGCTVMRDIVNGVENAKEGGHQVLTEGGRVVRCRRVLLCAGAFTKFKNLMPDLKFSIHRETVALVRVPEEESRRLSSMPPILLHRHRVGDMPSSVSGAYILPPIQYPDKHFYLKIGPMGHHRDSEVRTLEEVKQWYCAEAGDAETVEKLPRVLLDLIPGLRVEGSALCKTCVTTASPSGLPYLDRVSATVTVAAVGNGAGALACEEVGRMAAELAVRGRWDSTLPKEIFQIITE